MRESEIFPGYCTHGEKINEPCSDCIREEGKQRESLRTLYAKVRDMLDKRFPTITLTSRQARIFCRAAEKILDLTKPEVTHACQFKVSWSGGSVSPCGQLASFTWLPSKDSRKSWYWTCKEHQPIGYVRMYPRKG